MEIGYKRLTAELPLLASSRNDTMVLVERSLLAAMSMALNRAEQVYIEIHHFRADVRGVSRLCTLWIAWYVSIAA